MTVITIIMVIVIALTVALYLYGCNCCDEVDEDDAAKAFGKLINRELGLLAFLWLTYGIFNIIRMIFKF